MIDTRSSYRATPVKNDNCWRVQFRPWFWPFWKTIRWAHDLAHAEEIANKHVSGDDRKTVNFGKLPVRQ